MNLLSPLDNFIPHDPLPPIPLFYCAHPFPSLSPSPSDTVSSSPSPAPLVVCNVPLLAPRPLPYHSPTFLQFDLPDTDEDLSHPPYTHRPPKRKRDKDEEPLPQPKRRPASHRWRSRPSNRPSVYMRS